MDIVKLVRYKKLEKQTLGLLYCSNDKTGEDFQFDTLELPWLDNKRRISCIPTGEYKVIPRYSNKYGKHFHILDVPNRDLILIHVGNYYLQTLGCILVGDGLLDINKDGILDITNSSKTIKKLISLYPDGFKLIIEEKIV